MAGCDPGVDFRLAGGFGGMDGANGRRRGEAETGDADDSVGIGAEIDRAWDTRARVARIDDLNGAVRDVGGKGEVESDGILSRRNGDGLCDDGCGGRRWGDQRDTD